MSSLKQQSMIAIVWDFVGKLAGQSVSFVISIILARLLSPEDFGLLAMVNVVIAMATSLIDMGLGVAIIQRKDVSDVHYGSVFFFNITTGIALMLMLFLSAPFIASFYDNELLVPIARAMSLLFLFSSIGNVLRVKLRKELEYGIPTKAGLIAAILSGAIGVGMAFKGFGVWSLVFQALLNPVISNGYLFYKVKWRPKLIYKWEALKELWGFGFRMFLSGLLDSFTSNADSIVIGKLFSPSILGFYYRARSLNNYVVVYSSSSIMNVLFPTFSKLQDDMVRFRAGVEKGFHIINLLAFFFTGLFFVIGDALILFLFGEKWQPAIPYFRLIIVVAFGYPLSALLVNVLKALGNSAGFLKLEILKKIALLLALGFGFFWGIQGYLIFSIIVMVVSVMLNMHFAGKEMGNNMTYFLKMSMPYLGVSAVGAALFFTGLQYLKLNYLLQIIYGIVCYGAFYGLGVWLLKLKGFTYIFGEILSLARRFGKRD